MASRAGAARNFRVNFLGFEPWPEQERGYEGDAKVVDFLNKALRHELTAVNQYWLHYRLLDNWGYKDLAKQDYVTRDLFEKLMADELATD